MIIDQDDNQHKLVAQLLSEHFSDGPFTLGQVTGMATGPQVQCLTEVFLIPNTVKSGRVVSPREPWGPRDFDTIVEFAIDVTPVANPKKDKAGLDKADTKSIEPIPGNPKQPSPSVSVDPALSSWDKFLDIAEKLYQDRAKGKHSERKDNEVVDFASEFRAKMVTWEGKYEGQEKAGLSMRVKLDLPRPLSPPIVTTSRCAPSDAAKWSGVKEGATVRFSGKVAQGGTVWTKLKLPTGEEKRVQMLTVEITDVYPSSDKKGK